MWCPGGGRARPISPLESPISRVTARHSVSSTAWMWCRMPGQASIPSRHTIRRWCPALPISAKSSPRAENAVAGKYVQLGDIAVGTFGGSGGRQDQAGACGGRDDIEPSIRAPILAQRSLHQRATRIAIALLSVSAVELTGTLITPLGAHRGHRERNRFENALFLWEAAQQHACTTYQALLQTVSGRREGRGRVCADWSRLCTFAGVAPGPPVSCDRQ